MNDKYKLIVKCDIMIKRILFIKIFNEIKNVSILLVLKMMNI